jgi:SNF2 family DNA or RNA helicase
LDEYGVEKDVVVRNYQAQGIMNLLQVTRSLLGDDTGLGKTLQVLSVIGYVWLVEPDYVPIVITRKSSLYQWRDEANRFMTGMSVIISDGEPFERDEIYRNFFYNYNPSEKRLLVMTYDTFLKDAEKSVVRDRSYKPTKEDRKRLKEAKDFKKALAETYAGWKTKFRVRFDERDQETKDFLFQKLKPADEGMNLQSKPPSDWTSEDEEVLSKVLSLRHDLEEANKAIAVAKDIVEPPMVADGLLKHLAKFRKQNPGAKTMLVCDEIHVLKNHQGKLHKLFYTAAKPFNRVIGMTATPVKNRLMEFFAIFRIIYPELFPKVTSFQRDFCVMKAQRISGGRQIQVVVGHSKEQLDSFVKIVEPFYLSRRKHDVAKELPELVTREIICPLSPEQEELYDLAELLLAEAEADPDDDNTQTLKTMTMIRQACNAPQLLADEEGRPFDGDSSKIDQLVEILQENPDAKVLVFSAFERMISLIEARLKKEKINCTRITGKESNAKVRTEHVKTYQNPDSGVNVMLITSAGSESLNLQATEQLVFVDSPFSYGDYVQTIGRPQRIGSKHLTVLVTHLVARRQNGDKTIDDHVIKILRGKKKLSDSVSGEALKGGLQFTESDLVKEVMQLVLDAKRTGDRTGAREKMKHIHSTSSKKQKPTQKVVEQPSVTPAVSKVASGLYLDLDFSDI